ncbi:MAG: mechanosensitive ion channel domain-containing protein [Pseudomonadota bacterium]
MKLLRDKYKLILKLVIPVILIILLSIFYGTYISQLKSNVRFNVHGIVNKSFFVFAVIIISYWVKTIINALFSVYASSFANRTSAMLDNDFIPLIRRLVSIFLWIIAFTIILSYLGVNISALIATLGVGSLAIALAAQDTIANIIAGFLIMIDRPFKINDRIKLPSGEDVVVLNIGIRRSIFRSQDGATVIVPNLDLSKSKIINYSYDKPVL